MMKKIIICFDGTSNDPKDAKQKKNLKMELKDSSLSNIYKLHLLLGGDPNKEKQHIDGQKCLYYSGVGTYGNKLLQCFNAGLALPNMDVKKIMNKATDNLADIYDQGDEVFVFGFSRGAAIARRFAAKVNEDIKKRKNKDLGIRIRFLGVFDTVASVGLPNLDDDKKPISDVKFENCTIADTVDETLHMVSIDEKRTAFMPTLMAYEPKVTEIWFSGAHSDVGGGYRYDGLSDVVLSFLVDELKRRKLGLKIRLPQQMDFKTPACEKLGLAYDDMAIQPNPLGKSHQQDRSFLLEWTLTDRDLRVHIEKELVSDEKPVPLIHYSVVERIHGLREYRPVSLSKRTFEDRIENDIPHKIWRPDIEVGQTEQNRPVVAGLAEHLRLGPPTPKKLEIGESRLVTVYANIKMNRSYICANKNEAYTFELEKDQTWFDSGIACGPKGWDRDVEDFSFFRNIAIKHMEDDRRCPVAAWFEIVGTIGKRAQLPFRVLDYPSNDSNLKISDFGGELFFFANDLEDRYDNNLGFIQVRVHRTACQKLIA